MAIHLCRLYGRENVSYYNAGKEIDFVVEEQTLAIQVCYSMADSATYEREVTPLLQFATKHPGWRLLIITYDETSTIEQSAHTITVQPVWQWMIEEK